MTRTTDRSRDIKRVARATLARLDSWAARVVVVAIVVSPTVLYYVLSIGSLPARNRLLTAVTAGTGLTGIGLFIAAAWSTGRLFDHALWEPLVTRSGHRTTALVGVIGGGLLMICGVVAVVGMASSTIVLLGVTDGASAASPSVTTVLVSTLARPLVSATAWTIAGAALATLVRSSAASVAVAALWVLLLEPALAAVGRTSAVLPAYNLFSLGVTLSLPNASVAGLWLTTLSVIGVATFARRDLT